MSWLDAYMRYTAGQESPDEFHVWTALGILSAAVGRKAWLDFGYSRLYPNLYVVLVAASAVVRKSSALDIGVLNILKATSSPPNIIAEKVTPERMVEALQRATTQGAQVRMDCVGVVYAPELTVFLSKAAHEAGMVSILTSLYDNPEGKWRYETRTRGHVELHNPSLVLLGATTPKFLQYAIPNEAVGTGFLSRTIWVYADAPRPPIPIPRLTDEQRSLQGWLVKQLEAVMERRGEVRLDEEALQRYDEWYRRERDALLMSELGETLARWPIHVLKVAMLLSLSEGDSMEVSREHLELAMKLLDEVRRRLPNALSGVLTSKESILVERVQEVIERNGGEISHSDLVRKLWRHGKADDIAKAVDTLTQAGILESVYERGKRGLSYRMVRSKVERLEEQ